MYQINFCLNSLQATGRWVGSLDLVQGSSFRFNSYIQTSKLDVILELSSIVLSCKLVRGKLYPLRLNNLLLSCEVVV